MQQTNIHEEKNCEASNQIFKNKIIEPDFTINKDKAEENLKNEENTNVENHQKNEIPEDIE